MSFISALFGNKTIPNESFQVLIPMEFKQKVQGKSVQLIDVRTPREFQSGHIKGAKNIDFFSRNFNVEFDKLNKEKPLYLYCRSGSRSRQASKKLFALGFTMIYDLQGGILNYN